MAFGAELTRSSDKEKTIRHRSRIEENVLKGLTNCSFPGLIVGDWQVTTCDALAQ
jgi:hypothetical protein